MYIVTENLLKIWHLLTILFIEYIFKKKKERELYIASKKKQLQCMAPFIYLGIKYFLTIQRTFFFFPMLFGNSP